MKTRQILSGVALVAATALSLAACSYHRTVVERPVETAPPSTVVVPQQSPPNTVVVPQSTPPTTVVVPPPSH